MFDHVGGVEAEAKEDDDASEEEYSDTDFFESKKAGKSEKSKVSFIDDVSFPSYFHHLTFSFSDLNVFFDILDDKSKHLTVSGN